MSKHLPPIPPENVSPKGPGGDETLDPQNEPAIDKRLRNHDKQGRQGNSKINTTHQGYQQDR